MDSQEYDKQLRQAGNDGKKIKDLFDIISAGLTDNGYDLSAGISALRMLTFFSSVPYGRLFMYCPGKMAAAIIDGVKFIGGNLGRCGEVPEEETKAFAAVQKELMDVLDGIYWAGSDLESLLDLYEQENIIRNSEQLKPLYPTAHDFIEDTVGYLYDKMDQNQSSAEINKTIKDLVMLLPMGFVKNEFLSYAGGTLREAVMEMPTSIIARIHDIMAKFIRHADNPYYAELFDTAAKYGLDSKPGSLTDGKLKENTRRIRAFISRLDLMREITASILLMHDLIDDGSTKSRAAVDKYLYISDIIASYLDSKRVRSDAKATVDEDTLSRQIEAVSFLLDKADTFAKAGIGQSDITESALVGMLFTRYDSMYDRLHATLFNLFEYADYDESDQPAEDAYIDETIEDIASMIEDDLRLFPAFFRRERMRNIMNELPVGFNDIEDVHEYIHRSIDSIADDRLLFYTEALVSSLPDMEENGQ